MKRLYSVLVENRSGVLSKVSGLFARRCFNIDSLAVGETDDPNVSCITIVSSGDKPTLEQIEKQLNKKIDVIKIKTFSEEESISRELMLVKVKYSKANRREIMEICEILDARIVDMSKNLMMIQIYIHLILLDMGQLYLLHLMMILIYIRLILQEMGQ